MDEGDRVNGSTRETAEAGVSCAITLPEHASGAEPGPERGARPGVDDLMDLMRAFNETTRRLQNTHSLLRTEVTRLQGELAEANAQLRRSRSLAELGQMAAGIAHEIRNPVGAIRLDLQMLAEDLVAAPPAPRRLCDRISVAVGSIEAIVRDVLHFAREARIQPEPTSCRELMAEALRQCGALITEGDVVVEHEFPDADETLEADRTLLVQALANVIRNAIEAMTESDATPAVLRVSARRRRERCPDGASRTRIVLVVEDRGPGIPAEVVDRMFNPFFTTRHTGTGLGLAIVHRIVDAHGGHVRVRDARAGGTRVELCLPPRAAGASSAPSAEVAVFTGASVPSRVVSNDQPLPGERGP